MLVFLIAGLYIYNRFTGTDLLRKVVMSKPVIVALTSLMDAVCKILPNKTLKIISTVLDAAVDATEVAEKTWLMGELSREDRNPYAKSLARQVLVMAGIEVTPQIEAIISGVIEMTCMVLPHGVEPEGSKKENAELQ